MIEEHNILNIKEAHTPDQIEHCFDVMHELRHYLVKEDFVERITKMHSLGYKLIYIDNDMGKAVAAAGFRFTELLHWGKAIYIDDLSTAKTERGRGFGTKLLQYIHELAKRNNCAQIHLDSGCQAERFDAHRLYLNNGYNITSHHFTCIVNLER